MTEGWYDLVDRVLALKGIKTQFKTGLSSYLQYGMDKHRKWDESDRRPELLASYLKVNHISMFSFGLHQRGVEEHTVKRYTSLALVSCSFKFLWDIGIKVTGNVINMC